VEQVSHVIIDQSAMMIFAFSNSGRQVNLQFNNEYELMVAIHKCSNWLPNDRILSTI